MMCSRGRFVNASPGVVSNVRIEGDLGNGSRSPGRAPRRRRRGAVRANPAGEWARVTFPSITNRGEFFSNHYLDAVIGGDLGDLRKAWDEAEGKGEPSARSTLKGAASRFFKTRATASEATGDRAPAAIEHLNDVVLQALGFQPNRQNLDLVRNTTDRLTIWAAATAETGTGRWLVAIDAGLAEARCRPELPRQEARQAAVSGRPLEIGTCRQRCWLTGIARSRPR